MTKNEAIEKYIIPAIERTWNEKNCNKILEALERESCEDAISREDALMALTGEWTESRAEILPKAIRRIKALPSVQPEPKTGHWLDVMVGDMQAQACDQCKTFYPLEYTGGGHKYCPNCGAKMIEPQERS